MNQAKWATVFAFVLLIAHAPISKVIPGAENLNRSLNLYWAFFVSPPLGDFELQYKVNNEVYKIPAMEKGFFQSFSLSQIHHYKRQFEVYMAEAALQGSRKGISTRDYLNAYLCRKHIGQKLIEYIDASLGGTNKGLTEYQGKVYACAD